VRPDPLESAEGGDHTAVHKAIEPVVGIRAVSKEESLADDLKQRAESRWARRLRHVFGTAEERSPLFYGVLIGLAILLLGVLAIVHFGISSFGFSLVEGVVVAMAVCGLMAALSLKHGVEDISVWTGWLLIYLAGGVVLQLVARPILRGHAADVWLCYTAVWAVLYLCRLRLRDWIRRRAEDRAEIHAVHAQARLHNARHEAKLKLLPGHGWYLLASRVTALAMVGSFATTAIGFYQEIVDPHDVALLRYSIPVGLSALAALIIWTGWDYVFRKLRTARIMMMRCLAWGIGCVVLIPMTVAIHSVFGVIGVGGTEGLRAHHMWYANVLSGSYDLADRVAKAEIAMRPQIELMRVKFEQSAERERKGGSGCGAGEGDLFRYYTDRGKDAAAILKLIDERQAAFGPQNDLANAIETVKKRIRNPGKPFREAEAELGEAFKDLRTRILALESNSVKRSLEQFIAQLALVRNDRFFTGWAECQVRRKPAVQAEVESFLTEAQRSFAGMEQAILLARMEAAEKIPPEHRIDSVSALLGGRPGVGIARAVEAPRRTADGASEVSHRRFVLANLASAQRSLDREPDEAPQTVSSDDRMVNIPTFISLRPFWAVASYAGQLPGYIALQAALDFSPAILGFLFAIMAPLAKKPKEAERKDGTIEGSATLADEAGG
jgi:hypothetical protein